MTTQAPSTRAGLPGFEGVRDVLHRGQRIHGVAGQVFAGLHEEVARNELERDGCHEEQAHQAHDAARRVADQRAQRHADGRDRRHVDAVDKEQLDRLRAAQVQAQAVVVQDRHGYESGGQGGRGGDDEGGHHHHHELGRERGDAFGHRRERGPGHARGELGAHQQHAEGAQDQLGERDAGGGHADGEVAALGREPGADLRVPGRGLGELARSPGRERPEPHHDHHCGAEQDQRGEQGAELDEFGVEDPQEAGAGAGTAAVSGPLRASAPRREGVDSTVVELMA